MSEITTNALIHEDSKKNMGTSSKALPNKAFDMEYSTQTKREMLYLRERGIEPCFRKKTADYHIPTYKYTKTPELFRAVADYYEMIETQKSYEQMKKDFKNARPVVPIGLDIE